MVKYPTYNHEITCLDMILFIDMSDLEDDKALNHLLILNKITEILEKEVDQHKFIRFGTECNSGKIIIPQNNIENFCSQKDMKFKILEKVDFTYYKIDTNF